MRAVRARVCALSHSAQAYTGSAEPALVMITAVVRRKPDCVGDVYGLGCRPRRRADLISEGFVADYVALHWLEWNGGAPRLTVTGNDMCEQVRARMN